MSTRGAIGDATTREGLPILTIVGTTVALGPLRRDLVSRYHRWANDLATSRTPGLTWPATMEQEIARYDQRAQATNEVCFTVYQRDPLRPIGVAYLYEIEPRHARASFGITIGEADCRGKGYGTEATRLVLDYAFNDYGLQNVMLTVYEFNLAGRRAYEKAGFREFGRRRRCSRFGQRLWDLIYMECVASGGVHVEANG
ncbi:MAG: GNAT family N-acetyltransferase [Thermomicrobiales bacterium]